ncbi:hypothetical protein C7420_1168 [Pantoea ananatis]|nr:hypothetical protein C7420_1168 [Pantoea ananatis]
MNYVFVVQEKNIKSAMVNVLSLIKFNYPFEMA